MKPKVSFKVAIKPWRRGAEDVEPPVDDAKDVDDEREYVAPPPGGGKRVGRERGEEGGGKRVGERGRIEGVGKGGGERGKRERKEGRGRE